MSLLSICYGKEVWFQKNIYQTVLKHTCTSIKEVHVAISPNNALSRFAEGDWLCCKSELRD